MDELGDVLVGDLIGGLVGLSIESEPFVSGIVGVACIEMDDSG